MIVKSELRHFRKMMMMLKDSLFKKPATESYMNEYLYHTLQQRTGISLQENSRAVYTRVCYLSLYAVQLRSRFSTPPLALVNVNEPKKMFDPSIGNIRTFPMTLKTLLFC